MLASWEEIGAKGVGGHGGVCFVGGEWGGILGLLIRAFNKSGRRCSMFVDRLDRFCCAPYLNKGPYVVM